jgi:hypothetical protein
MALRSSTPAASPPSSASTRPAPPAPSRRAPPLRALRRYAFDDNEQRVDCGSAVVVAPDAAELACLSASAADDDEWQWTDAHTAEFLAGGPIHFSWVAPSPEPHGRGQVYVCCWISVGD